jgi:amino acid transporter
LRLAAALADARVARLPLSLTLGGLAQATLLTTYCYWGYYNICFLGGEVKRPERTIPRAILLSVLFVSAFYVAMNLAALPLCERCATRPAHASAGATVRLQLVADIARSAFGSVAGRLMAALIIWTAFASVFSLLLGYSRVPYAAARDGNYFRYSWPPCIRATEFRTARWWRWVRWPPASASFRWRR